MRNVIVFKDESLEYENELISNDYKPKFVKIIESQNVHQSSLIELILNGSNAYDGVVFTSQRAVESWKDACKAINRSVNGRRLVFYFCYIYIDIHVYELIYNSWNVINFYSVGQATTKAIEDLKGEVDEEFLPSEVIGGHTGNGHNLGEYIANENNMNNKHIKTLLHLIGDKTSSDLSNVLQSNQIKLDKLQVYETQLINDQDLLNKIKDESFEWIMIFSPSGAQLILKVIQSIDKDVKVSVIGPTTSKKVKEMGFKVQVEPKEPNIKEITKSMKQIDSLQS